MSDKQVSIIAGLFRLGRFFLFTNAQPENLKKRSAGNIKYQ